MTCLISCIMIDGHEINKVNKLNCRFTTRERVPGTDRIGIWVDLRTGLEYMEK
jgi:hypothetical protein